MKKSGLPGMRIKMKKIKIVAFSFALLFSKFAQAVVFVNTTGDAGFGDSFAHAETGGRYAMALAYGGCSPNQGRCVVSATATATNDYTWILHANAGFENTNVPLLVDWTLHAGADGYTPVGGASANVTIGGRAYRPPLVSFGADGATHSVTASGTLAINYRAGELPIKLKASAHYSISALFAPVDYYGMVWAYADPLVYIDPTFELASNFQLEEINNELMLDAQGVLPSNIDLSGLPLQLATVPAPAAVWLFGSGLLGLIGMAKRKA